MNSNNLPENLITNINFNELFNLKPKERSSVLVYNKEKNIHENKEIYRSYSCYLNVPEFDKNNKKSYMFLNKESKVPSNFEQFIRFAKSIDEKYNQMVVNWYYPEDYIEMHSDCTAKFIDKDSPILMINLNESNDMDSIREMLFENRETKEISSNLLYNNTYHIITNNNTHRHCIGKGSQKRISLTFRMIKE